MFSPPCTTGRLFSKTLIVTLLVLMMIKCDEVKYEKNEAIESIISELKAVHAPDKRVALFEISSVKNKNEWILSGETNLPEAKEAFLTKLAEKNVTFKDSITLLPHTDLGKNTFGVVRNSVSNIRSAPKHSAELATQATLGMPLRVLKKEGDWYLVQTPDQYISWMDYGGFTLMAAAEFNSWMEKPKLIVTKNYGHSQDRNDPAKVVSDLVLGNVLALESSEKNGYYVQYPDGREAWVDASLAQPYADWLQNRIPRLDEMIATSESFLGTPYLWGGTSTKGMDCSGFTKTIYLMQGLIIPRDASQQVHEGMLVDNEKNWELLNNGDLLFFGKAKTDSTKERVTHVGMWMGDHRFIHASGDGLVKINSVHPQHTDYDSLNANRYLKTKRFVDFETSNISNLHLNNIFQNNLP